MKKCKILNRQNNCLQVLASIKLMMLFLVFCSVQNYCFSQVSFTFNTQDQVGIIANKGTDINFWDISSWQTPIPPNYYATHFPFVKRVQLMTALGGNDSRDLFVNPQDTNTITDYDFNELKIACHNIIDQGLKPVISLAWVPQKLSIDPFLDAFGTNVRPPADYNNWYNYVHACLQSLVTEFGLNEVSSWAWYSGVEFENKEWFDDGISAATTKVAYFKLYDYTVAALESVLGANNVEVGVHSMTCSGGYWDERELIDHCVTGTNYVTGAIGTQLDFYQISYYDSQPYGFDGNSFITDINLIKNHLILKGLGNIPIGVGEGRVLKGWDNKPLNPREVLHPIQGSMDAKRIILMIDNDINWFST